MYPAAGPIPPPSDGVGRDRRDLLGMVTVGINQCALDNADARRQKSMAGIFDCLFALSTGFSLVRGHISR